MSDVLIDEYAHSMTLKKRFPTGIQTFSKIRGGDYYYVDKTPYLLDLLQEQFVFLSRPRRFGKSLTLDTIAELFEGNQKLFKGLYAEAHWDWTQTHPVIRLGFAGGIMDNQEKFVENVKSQLKYQAKHLKIEIDDTQSISLILRDLIEIVTTQSNKQVVLLIDEYDKPILDNLHDDITATLMRDALKDLYSIIKEQDRNIRFVMLTGVSKFSKVNLFSGLNNLTDITLKPEYSALCGYTQQELENVFKDELIGVDLNLVKRWYNGYNWTGQAVYNPYDILLFLSNSQKQFKPYWFETGSPAFLMQMLVDKRIDVTSLQNIGGNDQILSQFEVGDISPIALMFQTGYLTIDTVTQMPFGIRYNLKFPNIEVQQSFSQAVIHKFLPNNELQIGSIQSELYQSLVAHDLTLMFNAIQRFFAGIPYNWHTNNTIAHYEGYWASVFYAYFASIGLHIHVEEPTNQGRMDMTVLFDSQVYIFEFKVVTNESEVDTAIAQALTQIKEKRYADKYKNSNTKIHEIAVVFEEKARAISLSVAE